MRCRYCKNDVVFEDLQPTQDAIGRHYHKGTCPACGGMNLISNKRLAIETQEEASMNESIDVCMEEPQEEIIDTSINIHPDVSIEDTYIDTNIDTSSIDPPIEEDIDTSIHEMNIDPSIDTHIDTCIDTENSQNESTPILEDSGPSEEINESEEVSEDISNSNEKGSSGLPIIVAVIGVISVIIILWLVFSEK